MDAWISESDPFKQLLLAFGCAALGLVRLRGFRGFTLRRQNHGLTALHHSGQLGLEPVPDPVDL